MLCGGAGCLIAAIGGFFLFDYFSSRPPKEEILIKNFNKHRADFEKLRVMLLADGQLLRVAIWGVETTHGIQESPPWIFPIDRYNQYLALLKQIGGLVAYRDEGEPPDPGVCMWGYGFGGETTHINICWQDEEPTNQVASLEEHYQKERNGDRRSDVFRHIDGNWYIWTDR